MASSSPCPLHAAAGRDTRFSSLDTARCTILPVCTKATWARVDS